MKILIGGGSGLVGKRLVAVLRGEGHEVLRLVRRDAVEPDEVSWNPSGGVLNPDRVSGMDAVIHLGGASIAEGRWTADRKRVIRSSRVDGTALLAKAIAAADRPPKIFLVASAVGYYGSRGDERLTEGSAAGEGFLAEVCRDWEAASDSLLESRTTRVVRARLGIVLSLEGGALQKMALPFRLGLGGVAGTGEQYWSWITLEDAVGAILHLLTADVAGAVNLVAPEPPTNRSFTKALGRALHRPTVLPLPAFVVGLLMGEMGEALLLGSNRVFPQRLLESGYVFQQPELDSALAELVDG